MVPLVETLRAIATGYPSPYPRNIYGESFHTAMGDEITTLVMAAQSRDYVTTHTAVGEAGQPTSVIPKGATTEPRTFEVLSSEGDRITEVSSDDVRVVPHREALRASILVLQDVVESRRCIEQP